MKLSPNTNPPAPTNFLIRFHNQTGAAVDVTSSGHSGRWHCHGCGDGSHMPQSMLTARSIANEHAATCRASYHRLR
ncbi:hypothetical protein ACWGN5_07410 [Streptomyces sp. NPDC055815]